MDKELDFPKEELNLVKLWKGCKIVRWKKDKEMQNLDGLLDLLIPFCVEDNPALAAMWTLE